jgi:hypothetical protein
MSIETAIPTTPVGHHAGGLPEPSAVDAHQVLWIAGSTLIFFGVAVTMLAAVFNHEVAVKTVSQPQSFPQPRVQTGDTAELQQLLQKQRQELASYHWANDAHTLVQIPIERAMAIIAQKGAQAYAPLAAIPGALTSPDAGAERAITPTNAPPPGRPADKTP